MTTPRPARARPSLGEPTRLARAPRDRSPGAHSCGSADDVASEVGGHGAGERPLLAVGAGMNRQSLHPNASARQSRDPRPVGDRTYAKECAQRVAEFLNSRAYGKPVFADKFLKEPTNKDFFDVFKFLISKLDPHYEFEGPYESEVQQIMRRLKYPTEVNKSKLQAVNGPNTWPQLLAVLDWLIELICMNESYIQPLATCEVGSGDNEREWLRRSLQESYPKYLSGIDDHEEEERLKQIIHERTKALKEEIQRLQEHAVEKEQELYEYQSEHNKLVELQVQPKSLEKEADRERSAIQAQEVQAERIDHHIAAMEDKNNASLNEIETLEAAVRELQEKVEGQAYSKRDIERLKCERDQLRKRRDRLQAEGEKAEQEVWELAMKEQGTTDQIGRLAREVNAIVEATVGFGQEDLLIRVDASEPTDVLAMLDFAAERERAGELQKTQNEDLQSEEAALNQLIKEDKAEQDLVAAKEREIMELREILDNKSRQYESNRSYYVEQLEEFRRIVQHAEEQANQDVVGVAMRDVAEARQKLDDLKLHMKTMTEYRAQEIEQLKEQLRRDVDLSAELRRSVKRELDGYAGDVEALCRSVVASVQGCNGVTS